MSNSSRAPKPAAQQPRRFYSPPSLKVFGTIESLTRGNGRSAVSVDGGTHTASGSIVNVSDRRLKENIVRVDTHPLGFGLYLFDFRPVLRDLYGHGRQFGVMADEVEQVMPEAVGLHELGHRTVDYAMLGIRLH